MSGTRLLQGFHAVEAQLRRDPASVVELLADDSRADGRMRDLLSRAAGSGVRVVRIPRERLDALAPGGHHQGVTARVSEGGGAPDLRSLIESAAEPPLVLVLDGVQDPHNLGACLRSADAFGVTAVVVPKDRAAGMSPVVSKVASGAAESVPFFAVTNLARALREIQELGVWVVGTDDQAEADLYGADLAGPLAWVLGAEGTGLRRLTRETCDLRVRIPMLGAVESLNVSVACGICLFEARRQRVAAGRR